MRSPRWRSRCSARSGTRSSGPRRCGWGSARRRSPTPAGRRRGRSRSCSRTCSCSRPGWRCCARCSAPGGSSTTSTRPRSCATSAATWSTYVLVSGAAAGAASVLIGGCDQMASWFITRASAGSGFADHLANLLGLATAGTGHAAGAPAGFTVGLAGTVTTAFIAIVLGIIAFLATVIQIMLMLVRGGMLVLLVGTLPLVAAFSNTEMGLAVVPQGLGVADRVRAVQAGGRDRVRGRVRSRRPAGRAGAAGRGDDAGARDPGAAGAAAVRGAGDERAGGRGRRRGRCSPGRRAARSRCGCRPAPPRSPRRRRARTGKAQNGSGPSGAALAGGGGPAGPAAASTAAARRAPPARTAGPARRAARPAGRIRGAGGGRGERRRRAAVAAAAGAVRRQRRGGGGGAAAAGAVVQAYGAGEQAAGRAVESEQRGWRRRAGPDGASGNPS